MIRIGERETVVATTTIAKVELFTSDDWDDLVGLADVLALRLLDGTVLRIPDTCEGFWETANALWTLAPG
jgi:hypothetical protein